MAAPRSTLAERRKKLTSLIYGKPQVFLRACINGAGTSSWEVAIKELPCFIGFVIPSTEPWEILVPEPFIWYLLGCILEALRVLATPVPPHKKAMFHYDIKPANILLGDVDQSRTSRHWFRHYPRPILADFGGVEELPAPDYIYACGAVGYQPFEALGLETQNLTNTWRRRPARNAVPALPVNAPKDTATSIHELGMVCWRAMSLLRPVALLQVPPTPQPFSLATLAGFARQAHPPRHGDDDRPTPPFAAGSTAATTATTTAGGHDAAADAAARRHMAPRGALAPAYSARLVECVYRMLAPVAAERPPLAQLAAEVAGAADGFAQGAWAGPEAPQDWPPHPPLWPRGEGFARPRGVVVAWAKYPLGQAVLNDVYRP
ncbi:hypothetical protein GTA08_BOTSDO09681 [Neofusicoccum parvum]|nr:hypothetical protein GTA08_BOTSDO09681 [Neofusicoccum parvum]